MGSLGITVLWAAGSAAAAPMATPEQLLPTYMAAAPVAAPSLAAASVDNNLLQLL